MTGPDSSHGHCGCAPRAKHFSTGRLGKQLAKAIVSLMPALSADQIHLLSLSIMILLAGEARRV